MSFIPENSNTDLWATLGALIAAAVGVAWWSRRDQSKAAGELDALQRENGPPDEPGPVDAGSTH